MGRCQSQHPSITSPTLMATFLFDGNFFFAERSFVRSVVRLAGLPAGIRGAGGRGARAREEGWAGFFFFLRRRWEGGALS
jgi:hypothetical protein